MATIITLIDPMDSKAPACERHDGWPVHLVGEGCAALAGVRPYTKRVSCSVCDLEWGAGLISQHEGCRILRGDERIHSRPVTTYDRAGELVEIRYS